MTESYTGIPSPLSRESRIQYFSRVFDPAEVALLRQSANYMGVSLYNEMPAFQGGGILGKTDMTAEKAKRITESKRAKASVLGHTRGSTEPNAVVHFPTNKEHPEYPANFYAYQQHLGEYIRHNWNTKEMNSNPLPGVFGHMRLEDGRYVIATQYRLNYEPLSVKGNLSAHLMDTSRISPAELRQVVRVLDAIHVDANAFSKWAQTQIEVIPDESWMNSKNPNYAFRGKEWWISPTGEPDRMTELTKKAKETEKFYTSIDPNADIASGISTMIKNNIELYPHKDGAIDHPDLAGDTVVVHGALHPDHVHIKRDKNGDMYVTVSGGDRAQGMGLRGQMIDWLVTSAASSPEHQNAMIDEFLKLHPGQKDKRGLAMHIMYRSVMEAPWFESRGKKTEAANLASLTLDILKGNGVWAGVNTPLTPR